MPTWVVIASGQSLTREDVDRVRLSREDGAIQGVIAVSNVGIDMAPWADFLVSADEAWWKNNPKAMEFKGTKFCRHYIKGTRQYISYINGCNSGLMAMFIALEIGKAKKIILLGFDMHGTHYFGRHPDGLKNTDDKRFKDHIAQFKKFPMRNVVNATPDSHLDLFPKAKLCDII